MAKEREEKKVGPPRIAALSLYLQWMHATTDDDEAVELTILADDRNGRSTLH